MNLSPHSRDLAEYGSVLRRRWPFLLSCLIAGVVGGVAVHMSAPTEYTAVAQVQVLSTGVQEQMNPVTPRQREPLNLDTEAQIAQSTVVAEAAARIIGNADTDELRKQVDVDVPPNSAILAISFSDDDPESAAVGAQAFADAYLRNRHDSAADMLAAALTPIVAKLHEVNAELDEIATDRQAGASPAAHHQSMLVRQAADLTRKQDSLKMVPITPGTVISPARPPARPSAPSAPIIIGSGLFLGLLAGAGTAFVRDRLDTRLREAGDVERLTGLPLLAEMSSGPEPTAFHELAAIVVTALGDDCHTVLLEGLGAEGHDKSMAKGLGAALAHLAPISVVTGRGARPDAAVLLAALGRTTSTEVEHAVRHLTRQGARVLGVVTVPRGPAVAMADTAEHVA